jgi:dienelactone hydrolase
MMYRKRAGGILAALVLGQPSMTVAATDPGLAGPLVAALRTESVPVTGGDVLSTDVHYPASGTAVDCGPTGRCPLIVYGHGFSSNKDAYAGHGAHWASRGFITMIPTMVGGADHSKNADDLVAVVTWALVQDQDPASFLYGHIDRQAIGMSGHSAGGLSSLVATARDARVQAAAPMDPVDAGGLGEAAVAGIRVPVAIAYSEDSACNGNGSPRTLYAACVPIKRGVKIVGATHCDPINPPQPLCDLFCGGTATAARQESYRRYVTGWFEYWLKCDASYFDWVYGARVSADVAAGVVIYQADPDPGPLPCVTVGLPPGPVSGLLAWRSNADVELAWSPVTASPTVTGYRLYRCDSKPFVFGLPRSSSPGPATTDSGGVAGGTLHFYQVRAVNAAGEGL